MSKNNTQIIPSGEISPLGIIGDIPAKQVCPHTCDSRCVPIPYLRGNDLLDSLITSKTRLKLILKFFLNPETSSHLRGLAAEFGESTNAVRVELNRLSDAGLLETSKEGRNINYRVNTGNTLFPDIQSIVKKYLGIDEIIESIVKQLGNVELALITGDYARGIDSGLIDLVLVGDIDKTYLQQLVEKSEALIHRKIRTLVVNRQEMKLLKEKFQKEKALLLWRNEA